MEFLDLQTGMVVVIASLTGAVGVLWRVVSDSISECKREQRKCEDELNKLWHFVVDLDKRKQGGPQKS